MTVQRTKSLVQIGMHSVLRCEEPDCDEWIGVELRQLGDGDLAPYCPEHLYPYPHPADPEVMVVGRDEVGLIAEVAAGYRGLPDQGFRYYLTDCCLASAKGSMGDVVCRECYQPIDERLGGAPS